MKKILTLILITMLLLSVAAVASAATSTETGTGITVVKAADWTATYADVYASYMKNAENEAIIDHAEEYPMIATVYEGMAFNKYYGSTRSLLHRAGRDPAVPMIWRTASPARRPTSLPPSTTRA